MKKSLAHDLFQSRRQMLKLLIGAPLVSCGVTVARTGTCSTIPEETAGPYPGDGSNGVNALSQSGIVRRDIRGSFGSLSGTAAGIPLTVKLTLVGSTVSCEPLVGYALYLWHCDRDGSYSLYTIANQNYLRGVQETDANGQVTFTTIFPGCYSGRWPDSARLEQRNDQRRGAARSATSKRAGAPPAPPGAHRVPVTARAASAPGPAGSPPCARCRRSESPRRRCAR